MAVPLRPQQSASRDARYDPDVVLGDLDCWIVSTPLDSYLDAHTFLEAALFSAIGADEVDVDAPKSSLDDLRRQVASYLSPDTLADIDSIDIGTCTTRIWGHFVHAWLLAGVDPAAHLVSWLWEGAPPGFEVDFD